jgi:hypothetical protein
MNSDPHSPAQQDMMLFPLKADIEFPPSINTADSIGEVEASDGHRYYVKADKDGKQICASEWLCTKIAEQVGIAGPHPVLIQMLDGSLVFGSRRIAGVSDIVTTQNFLNTPSQSNIQGAVIGLSRSLSNVYAFDLFMNNVDRHFGNYLSIEDAGSRRLYAFDYSRALFWAWPFSGFPQKHENTRTHGARLWSLHGFDQVAAFTILDQLNSLSAATIEGFINQLPAIWMPDELKDAFMLWWRGDGKRTRVNALHEGIANGQLL